MKILFICENYLPHMGGAEVVFKNLAERYVKRGHQVSLITHQLKGTKKEEVINGVKVYRIHSYSRYLFTFLSIPQCIKLAREHDIIQTTSFNGAPPAWLAGEVTGKKVVITVHELWIGKWQEVTGFKWLKSKIHDLLERAIYSLKYDKYMCVSNATKKDLLNYGIKENKIQTAHNGLDYQFWNPDNFDGIKMRDNLNLKDKFVYFSWGRPGESKGFEHVIKAVPKIKENLPNSIFLLMLSSIEKYKGKYLELMNLIKTLNLEDDIKILPPAPYQELGNYIKAADCIVIPSIAEGFGYTTTESIAMGKPVVVSNAGSLPEVVSGKFQMFENKNHIQLAEAVVKIANNEYNETEIKKFEWDPSVEKYLQVYEELLNTTPQPL